MNSKFYLGLKKVRYSYKDYPNASDELFEYYNELIEEIKKHQLNNNEALTKYVVQAYNQITEEQKRIIKWCENMGKIDLKSLSKIELNEFDINEHYYKEIQSISDSARAICIEYLAAYCPEMFGTVEKQKLLKEMLPSSIVAKSVLNSHDNSTNIKYIETETKPEQKKTEKLSDIITHDNSVEIVSSIKVRYKNIKGKRLKILLMVFQDLKLLPKEKIAKKFHECCENEFEWEIASYNAMNGYLFNKNVDSEEFDTMKEYFETLIKSK